MRIRTFLILPTLLSSLVLFACGAATNEAKGPEKDPWAGYKGTYATAATAKEAKADVAKSEGTATKAEPAAVAEAEPVAEEAAPAPAAEAKSAKKAKGGAAKAPKAAAAPKKKK